MKSARRQHDSEQAGSPFETSLSLNNAPSPGEVMADSGNDTGACEPSRRAWWMKHLSLLAVLQAACLAIGLTFQTDGLAGQTTARMTPFLLTFSWITLIQGGLGYLIFSRLYRTCLARQTRIADQFQAQQVALSRTRDAVVLGLTRMAESRDDETEGHLERVGLLAARLSEAARRRVEFRTTITPEFVRLIQFSATLHDIGKVGIEDAILQKPGSLTADERERMQRHTRISSSCLQEVETSLGDANFLQMAHEIALCHHERWDGSGYPAGISGEQIPLAARIVSIVDVYDALAAKRPYKEPYDHDRCVAIITAGKGSQFDPRLLEVFLEIHDEFRELAQTDNVGGNQLAETPEVKNQAAPTPVASLNPRAMPAREFDRILAEVNIALSPAEPAISVGS
jgi:HD-GYP domain-containing protein (c-di-GMP phosphodiesterase class II)